MRVDVDELVHVALSHFDSLLDGLLLGCHLIDKLFGKRIVHFFINLGTTTRDWSDFLFLLNGLLDLALLLGGFNRLVNL